MNARTFLVYGLLAGLLAGLATFLVAYNWGEPQVDAAIAVEEANAAAEEPAADHDHADEAGHSHGDEAEEDGGTEVSRATQSTWGLLTGTLAVGLATGGIVGLVSGGVAGRMGRLSLGQSTTLVVAIGFAAYELVPFLKYPATPPAVGDPETIGSRTGLYFAFVLVSIVVAIIATVLAVRLQPRIGTYGAVVSCVAGYLVIMVVAGLLFPTVNEIGDFPADTLWYFRRASLLTLATMWTVIGVVLVGLLGRLQSKISGSGARPAVSVR